MTGKIFISYRRSETAWAARALFERLRREFDERVFIDIEGLSLGIDYTQVIDAHLEGCEVMLALIGPHWLQEIQKRAAAHSQDGDAENHEPDWVRTELTRALLRNIPVVPVLIEGAQLPLKKDLPAELKGLRNRNGMELHPKFFDHQTNHLVREIGKIINAPKAVIAEPVIAPTVAAKPIVRQRERWMSNEGSDNFGRWAEFEVKGVVQRMRWIAPGEFWMGSPETEKERGADEQRHHVALTRGFWLANIACTQALWQAVTGYNPSAFTGDPLRPVEQVSWDMVQKDFLPKLSLFVPGLDAILPTEAQWEFACRAGTQTPFSFGENITTAQANCDGYHPYAGAAKGEYRKKTVAVKTLPPNAWGLYEMHGNVWEWCADAYGPYGADDAIDPTGTAVAAARVLRGGSWGDSAQYLRAAYRFSLAPVDRFNRFGFRVCRMCPIG
jgi:formylglycine-generating enzyme required for sulfatase activity